MSQDKIAFEKFFPRPLAFADKAHELEMMSKWNDAKVTWETSLEAATAEANKRVNALEGEVAELKAWKDEAIQVESEWDCQAVAEALNIPLGQSIRTNILPKIIELQANNNDLREALGQLITHTLECEKRLDEFHGLGDNAGSGCSDVICNSKQALSTTPAEPKE